MLQKRCSDDEVLQKRCLDEVLKKVPQKRRCKSAVQMMRCCRSGTAEVPQKRSRPRNGAAKAVLKRGTAKVPQKRRCKSATQMRYCESAPKTVLRKHDCTEPLTLSSPEPHWVAAGSGQEGAQFAVQDGTGYMCVTFFIWDTGLVQHNPPRNIS